MYLWKFTRGYVKIILECCRPERMVSLLVSEGVALHNMQRKGIHKMLAVISLRDYQLLCDLAETYGCTVTALSSSGLPVCLKALLGRPMLIFSVILWLAAGIIFSRRVFIINIIGCDAVKKAGVLSLIEETGIKRGAPKAKIDSEEIKRALYNYDERVSFADIRLHGVVLTVVIREADAFKPSGRDDAPSSIYADKDCVIVKLTAGHGNPKARPGQAVKRGELLISGDITPERANPETRVKVAAEGVILGQTAYRFSVRIERGAEIYMRTGKRLPFTDISLFGLKPASKISFPNCERERQSVKWLAGCGLPVKVESGFCYELIPVTGELSDAAMTGLALKKADALILKTVPKAARLITRSSELYWNGDGSLIMTVNLQTIEKIGYSRYI